MSDSSSGRLTLSAEKRDLLALLLREKGIDLSPSGDAAPIPRRPASATVPLHLSQEGLWFLEQLDPGKANHSIPGTARLTGPLHVGALQRSLSEIVRRHDSLRTTFTTTEDATPVQVVTPHAPLRLPLIDLETLSEAEREAEALRLVSAEARSPFDLSRGPLFRTALLRLSAHDHILSLNLHHIIADGWSMGVLTHELSALYEAFSTGKPSPLPELPIQYADVALWQQDRMRGEVLDRHLSYWKQQLHEPLPVLELPTDRQPPPVQSFLGSHQSVTLSEHLTVALRALARHERVTVYMILLAAFKALLHCATGQTDIIVGSTFANRGRRELEGLIGLFVNTLPLRTDASGNPRFPDLLQRVRDVVLGAHAHQELSLSRLARALRRGRSLSHNPFYRVVFDLLTPDHNPAVYGYGLSSPVRETRELRGLTMAPVPLECGVARFDVAAFLWDMPHGISGTVEYRSDLFESGTIARMVERFETLLRHVVAEPDVTLRALAERLDRTDSAREAGHAGLQRDLIHEKLKSLRRRPLGREA